MVYFFRSAVVGRQDKQRQKGDVLFVRKGKNRRRTGTVSSRETK